MVLHHSSVPVSPAAARFSPRVAAVAVPCLVVLGATSALLAHGEPTGSPALDALYRVSFGVAIPALAFVRRRHQLESAVIIGAAVAVGLRLPTSLPRYVPSLAAASIGWLALLWNVGGASRKNRKRIGWVGALLGASVIAIAIVCMAAVGSVYRELNGGITSTKAGLALGRSGDATNASADIARATTSFNKVSARLHSPLLRPALALPVAAGRRR